MRFHKAIAVTKPEADFIIRESTSALSGYVVISRGEKHYDVRSMSPMEVEAFIDDLSRAEHATLDAAAALPC